MPTRLGLVQYEETAGGFMREVTKGESGSLVKEYGERGDEVRGRVATYMDECPIVLASPSLGEMTALRSDGEWLWSTSGAFARGEIDVEPEFVAHVLSSPQAPLELSDDTMKEALALVMRGGENGKEF